MADAVNQAIIGKLVDYLVDALRNQASYLCCYSCNVPRLVDEVRELSDRCESVKEVVRAAGNNLENVTPVVNSWLGKVEEVKSKSDMIRKAAEEVGRNCVCKWFPVVHYSLSRDAAKTTEVAIKLQMEAPSVPISIPRIPAEMDPIPQTSEIGIKSRDEIEEQIMNAVKDETVYLLGLCGMGGVGKTTMAKKIEKRVRDQKPLFDHVLMAIVSQQSNLPNIQNQIAEGLDVKLSEESLIYRARKLHERLVAEKGVLIILDDVWETLNLEELGIPSQRTHPGCKVILTSRMEETFTLAGNPVSKIFRLEVLNDEESWILFKDNAGSAIDSADLLQIAKDIARECKGLPLALKIVGRALNGKSKSSWENAIIELRKSMPINIPGVVRDVYQPLMFSVNQLESEEVRHLFQLCCLFQEDYNISLEELVRLGIGLRIFEGLENLTVARIKVETILKILISRSLLIDSSEKWTNFQVKMHDVIRDVAIWIASKKNVESEGKHVFMIRHGIEEWPMIEEESYGDYTCISLLFSKKDVLIPEFIDYPRLEFLWVQLVTRSGAIQYLNIPENFFSGMRKLRVLEVRNFGSLPSSIGVLSNLRTLRLSNCHMFETTSMIGNLINLEILCLNGCFVDVLPIEIGGLKKLRQLDISYCAEVKIAVGVISGLVRLEELVILHSFDSWEADQGNGATNACLVELDCLNHLTTLKIEIGNPSVIPTQMPRWVQNVKKYDIFIPQSSVRFISSVHNTITLGSEVVTPLGDWFYEMTCDTEYLILVGPSCSVVLKWLARYSRSRNCLKDLALKGFSDVQYLVEGQQNGAIFPALKFLFIEDSRSLQEISNVPPPVGSFAALESLHVEKLLGLTRLWQFPTEKLCLSNLNSVSLHDCENLAYLFSLSVAQSLSRLENLGISNCPSMKEIFKKEDEEMEINNIKFPKLDFLNLESMESLCRLCKGVDGIEVPTLRTLVIENLPSIITPDIRQLCLFEQQFAGNFSGLQILRVTRIHNLKYLFSSSVLSGVSNLKELEIENCSELEEVIEKDENMGKTTLLPKLKSLKLFSLPKILAICYTVIELPSLEQLNIRSCPLMKRLSQALMDVSNLRFYLPFFNMECAGNFSGLQILRVEGMHNLKCLFSPSILSGVSNLKELAIKECSELEEVIGKGENVGETTLFLGLKKLELSDLPKIINVCYTGLEVPSLEELRIGSCPLMEKFSQGLSNTSNSSFPFFSKEFVGNFSKLQVLKVTKMENLKCLFSASILNGFSNLKELRINECSKLEEVIENDENVGEKTLFPELKMLELVDLPKIITFWYIGVKLPSLEESIGSCHPMERFSQRLSDTSSSKFYLPFFSKEVNCPKLEYLCLSTLPNITGLFSPSAFRALTNLKDINVGKCKELEEVIAKEEIERLTNYKEILSPRLEKLELQNLPKIRRFCHMKHCLEFPSLERVIFDDCPMLERFSFGPLHLPNIKGIHGLSNAEFAAKFFFNKEISSSQIQPENNCFTISMREMSLSFGQRDDTELEIEWYMVPDLSESFVDAVWLRSFKSVDIIGNFEMTKLIAGVEYEIVFTIMLHEKGYGFRKPMELELTLPGGITQERREFFEKLSKGKWFEISLGKFTRESHQTGQLKFALRLPEFKHGYHGLCIKGVRIMKA